ncbi:MULTISPECIES: LysR family transcriptional regulator [Micrococcaceae]|uniref:LysR family transcriptional regulator n=1 Tax=unclassified Kocuria TaxID=2649579 RepID=UPI0010101C43|nr:MULTISPECIES: LysR family transcriptional regulator [unclassified Kocuria]
MFTLDQLRCFVAVAENLHFGRAAEELAMTQPPLSRQIQKLEKSVGAQLILRTHRRVELTAAGSAFLDQARLILTSVTRAGESAVQASQGLQGRLSLGYTAAAGLTTLGPILTLMKERMPGVAIDLHQMVTSRQLEALEDGRINAGLGRLSMPSEGFRTDSIHTEGLVLAAPDGHELLTGRHLHREDVLGHPLIMHSAEGARYFYDLVVRNFKIDHADVSHSLSQITTMVSLVAAGHGIALVPESATKLNFPGVTYRQFDDLRKDIVELQLITLAERPTPTAIRLRQLMDSLPPDWAR